MEQDEASRIGLAKDFITDYLDSLQSDLTSKVHAYQWSEYESFDGQRVHALGIITDHNAIALNFREQELIEDFETLIWEEQLKDKIKDLLGL